MHPNHTVPSDASSITIEKEDVQEDSTTACSSDSPPASASSVKEEPQPEEKAEPEYVTGIPLYLTLFGLTLVAVLVMIGSCPSAAPPLIATGDPTYYESVQLPQRYWVVRKCLHAGHVSKVRFPLFVMLADF
jgi:hypothetical protein